MKGTNKKVIIINPQTRYWSPVERTLKLFLTFSTFFWFNRTSKIGAVEGVSTFLKPAFKPHFWWLKVTVSYQNLKFVFSKSNDILIITPTLIYKVSLSYLSLSRFIINLVEFLPNFHTLLRKHSGHKTLITSRLGLRLGGQTWNLRWNLGHTTDTFQHLPPNSHFLDIINEKRQSDGMINKKMLVNRRDGNQYRDTDR